MQMEIYERADLFKLFYVRQLSCSTALQAGNSGFDGPRGHCQQLVGRRRVDSRVRPSGNHRRPIDHRCPADFLKKLPRAESERGL